MGDEQNTAAVPQSQDDAIEAAKGILRGCRLLLDRPFDSYEDFTKAVHKAKEWFGVIETVTGFKVSCITVWRPLATVEDLRGKYVVATVGFSFLLSVPACILGDRATGYIRLPESRFQELQARKLW